MELKQGSKFTAFLIIFLPQVFQKIFHCIEYSDWVKDSILKGNVHLHTTFLVHSTNRQGVFSEVITHTFYIFKDCVHEKNNLVLIMYFLRKLFLSWHSHAALFVTHAHTHQLLLCSYIVPSTCVIVLGRYSTQPLL